MMETKATRELIFAAAEKRFAECGYTAASIQDIVSAAGLSKPTLYYHFGNKEGLFRALVDYAYDECFRLMQEGAAKSSEVETQITEMFACLFDFLGSHRDLTRLVYATAFAAPGELPEGCPDSNKRHRNFEFVHGLVKEGVERGLFNNRFSSKELAYGLYGALSFNLMANLFYPERKLDRQTAEQVVRLFLEGAARQSD